MDLGVHLESLHVPTPEEMRASQEEMWELTTVAMGGVGAQADITGH